MRALEALDLSPPRSAPSGHSRTFLNSASTTNFPKLPSFTVNRHITIPPLSTEDHDRPAHLPSHFIKTPYPFTAKKEFPKPESRPRQRLHPEKKDEKSVDDLTRLDSGYGKSHKKEYDDSKGKHVLGLTASDGGFDLRSRLERNGDAQGVVRSPAGSGIEATESVVWLSISRKQSWQPGSEQAARRVAKIVVPSNLTTSSPDLSDRKNRNANKVEFDDTVFAERLQAAHRELAGSWVRRALSARRLRRIQLCSTCVWSGGFPHDPAGRTSELLSMGQGMAANSDSTSPFTEEGLMKLFKKPGTGRARYTWVHWAHRVAASNDPSVQVRRPSTRARRRARSPNSPMETGHKSAFSPYSDELNSVVQPEAITSVQFVHSLSMARILIALALMLLLSVAAVLLWVFLGPVGMGSGLEVEAQRGEKVGPGIAVGILVLLMQSLGFGAWVWLS
ncbi:hypothetical protein ACN47E_003937 [Coniothyrium glycines]